MSAVSAIQRVITDSVTKVVAKNPFRQPETTDKELLELAEIPQAKNKNRITLRQADTSSSTQKKCIGQVLRVRELDDTIH